MSNQSIPARAGKSAGYSPELAAVEAAWYAFHDYHATRSPANNLEAMRAALEAAAPCMMAGAWDEGREEGYEAGRDRGAKEQPNPYRPTNAN